MQHRNGRNGNPLNDQVSKKMGRWRDYFSWMVSYAEKLVGTNDAPDVANAALLDAYCSDKPQPSLDNEIEVKKYLATLIWWRARAFWKKDRKYRQQVLFWADLGKSEEQVVLGKPWETILDLILLQRTLEKLSPEDQDLILKYLGEGFTAEELAAKHEMNESTLRSRIDRARKRINEQSLNPQRKPEKALGLFFPIDQIQMGLAKLKQSIISWLAMPSLTKVLVGVSIGAASAILLPQSSASEGRVGTAFDANASGPTHHEMIPVPWHSALEFNETTAQADVPKAVATNRTGSRPPKAATPEVPKPEPAVVKALVTPEIDAAPPPLSRIRSCNNALGLAFVKANNGDSQACLDILAENAAGPTKCSDDELQTARKLCQPSPPR